MWKAPRYRWEFKTIDKNEPNAFCLPGGKVAVYTGLLPITRTEAGLAVVIGHEVAHALARHGAERLSDQMVVGRRDGRRRRRLPSTGRPQPRLPMPAMMAAMGAGATVGFLLPMSRAQESEADHIGLVLMAMAGYDPREAIGLWERMRAAKPAARRPGGMAEHPSRRRPRASPTSGTGCPRP